MTKAPDVPAWNPVTLGASQTKAISENAASLPALEKIGAQVNTFNQQQIESMLKSVIPGFDSMNSQVGKNIADLLGGKIPTDVSQAVQGSAAARALTGGFGGSGMAGNLTARDLGLTSLNLMNTGLSSFESWTQLMDQLFVPGQFNISSMFVTPQQEFQDTMANQQQQVSRDWLQNQLTSAHDPMNIIGNSLIQTDAELVQLASSFLGGAAGKMMG